MSRASEPKITPGLRPPGIILIHVINQIYIVRSFLETDNQLCLAEKYLICADELILCEASDMLEAVTTLIHLVFTFDINYPQMPLVFEFLER